MLKYYKLNKKEKMDEDKLNIEIRKFLKKVGITSQREIEKGVYKGLANKTLGLDSFFNITMTLNIKELGITHEIKEKISIS